MNGSVDGYPRGLFENISSATATYAPDNIKWGNKTDVGNSFQLCTCIYAWYIHVYKVECWNDSHMMVLVKISSYMIMTTRMISLKNGFKIWEALKRGSTTTSRARHIQNVYARNTTCLINQGWYAQAICNTWPILYAEERDANLVTQCVYTYTVHFCWLVDVLMYPVSSPDSRVTGMISGNYLLRSKLKLYGHTACQMPRGISYLLHIMPSIIKKSFFLIMELFYCNTIIVNVISIVNIMNTRHVTFPSTFAGMENEQLDFMPDIVL